MLQESTEPRNRKSRWGAVSEPEALDPVSQSQTDCATTPTPSLQSDVESRGEKRRHTSQSPDRVSRKRSRTPIREDEPALDTDVVQLSWSESNLTLPYFSLRPVYLVILWFEDTNNDEMMVNDVELPDVNNNCCLNNDDSGIDDVNDTDGDGTCSHIPDMYIALFVPLFYVLVAEQ